MTRQHPLNWNGRNAHIVLAGPCPSDRQQSMERYTQLLVDGLSHTDFGVSLHRPANVFAQCARFAGRFRKHLIFLDKFVLFPRIFARRVRNLQRAGPVLVHVLDQGNAPYLLPALAAPILVTCHDLIAAKAALLPSGGSQLASRSLGRWFHSRVVQTLQRTQVIVCDSDKTLADCKLLLNFATHTPKLKRVHVPLDPFFHTAPANTSSPQPFLLHVGNSAWYKNRAGLFSIYRKLCDILHEATPPLHLYGEPLQAQEMGILSDLQLHSRVKCLAHPSSEAIRLAYHQAAALVFPSLEEGFGWPPLEAMACGCPVFVSDRPPLTEVCGNAAEYFDPADSTAAAALIASRLVAGNDWRDKQIVAGLARAAQFNMKIFMEEMAAIYQGVLDEVHQY